MSTPISGEYCAKTLSQLIKIIRDGNVLSLNRYDVWGKQNRVREVVIEEGLMTDEVDNYLQMLSDSIKETI